MQPKKFNQYNVGYLNILLKLNSEAKLEFLILVI